MGKNLKKVLSYALGIILAMGIGLTYAYAVGANDSNAFVTKTEWQAKIDKLETSLDAISKTIHDNNMDFVMNSSRLQVSMVDGFENFLTQNQYGNIFNASDYTGSTTDKNNLFPRYNQLILLDQWNGTQYVSKWEWNANSYAQQGCKCRFALKTNVPDTYIVVSYYYFNGSSSELMIAGSFDYVKLGPTPSDYSSAQSLSVTLSLDEWWPIRGSAAPTSQAKTSSYIYTGTVANGKYFQPTIAYSNNNDSRDSVSNPGTGYITRDVQGNNITFTWDFPATACTMRQWSGNSPYCMFNLLPLNMEGKKFGGPYDKVAISTSPYFRVAKVYSPQKGCLALKSYFNGEIPILNE